jgi:MoCo/4Fe-4S cofactor protein with predicted Tat translocation signal
MEMNKKYWKGIDELKQTPEFIKHKEQEFPNQQLAADHLGVKKQAVWNVLNGYINKKSGNKITHVKGYKFIYK